MAEPADSGAATSSSTAPSGPGGGSGLDSAADAVPRSEHETAIEAERKRRAGQERAHQRELAKVRQELAELKVAIQAPASGVSTTFSDDTLSSLDPRDPRDALLLSVHQNQAQWSQHQRREADARQQQQRLQQAVEEAVEEAAEDVPRAALDLSTPESVHRSAEKWRDQERIRVLEERLAAVEGTRVQTQEAARRAVTQERVRLGATQVLTSTGEMPPLPAPVQEEIQRLQQAVDAAKRRHQGAEVIRLNRQIAELTASG